MQTLDSLLAQAVPIEEALIIDDGAARIPHLWIDAAKRPDIADLTRVHHTEGDGDYTYRWLYVDEHLPEALIILQVDLERPVKERFTLVFPLPVSVPLLASIAQVRLLHLLTGTASAFPKMYDGPRKSFGMLLGNVAEGIRFTFDKRTSRGMHRHLRAWCKRHPRTDAEAWLAGLPASKAPKWWWPFGRGGKSK